MILVSACLLGICSKYDGTSNNAKPLLLEYAKRGFMMPICPEQLGGLGTPRRPVEIEGGDGRDVLAGRGKAFNDAAQDMTQAFVAGAREVLRIAQLFGVRTAILKEGSPSCGSNWVYDGTFHHVVRPGMGVTAALLAAEGITVYSEHDISAALLERLAVQE